MKPSQERSNGNDNCNSGNPKRESKDLIKAIAVFPGKRDSVHLAQLPDPKISDVPNGRGVLVKVLRCGLVTGHENFGEVIEVGSKVTELKPGDYAVATVRRPGASLYDKMGMSDMDTDDVYFEHGISHLHGFLTEYYVDDPQYIVKIPQGLKKAAVLMEPLTVAEKGIAQAYEIQRRLKVWRPQRAAVMGAGSIGLLVTLVLRLRDRAVTTFSPARKPNLNADLVEAQGARYISTQDTPLPAAAQQFGPFDIVFEATGYSPVAFDSMQLLGKNGVLVLSSVTGGDRKIEVASDKINLAFVLGNRVMVGTVNANREHFEMGVSDMAHAEAEYPGWLERLLTHPVRGLDNYKELIEKLNNAKGAIRVFCEGAPQ